MLTKSSKEYFDTRFNRLEQIQDFSTVLTTFLAIVFSLFIFSVTAIIINYSPILTVISYLMILPEILLLYSILISIFSSQWDTKLAIFSLAIWFTTFIPIYLLISYLYVQIRYWIYESFVIDNVGVVIVTFLTFSMSLPLNIWILDPRYRKRFKLLFEKPKKPGKYRLLDFIDAFLQKMFRKIGVSFLISIFPTILTGLVKLQDGYGFPLYWFLKSDKNIWEIKAQNFFFDIFFFAIIIFLIISLINFLRKSKTKGFEQNKNPWENSPFFFKN